MFRPRRSRVDVLFVGPESERFFMSWPGAAVTPEECQTPCVNALTEAAGQLDVQLSVRPVRLDDSESVTQCVAQLQEQKPDGLIVVPLHLQSWPQVHHLVENRGDVPTIVFAPLGTSFSDRLQSVRKHPRTLVVSTYDVQWLKTGLRMLQTISDLRNWRVCMVSDVLEGDHTIDSTGTVLHYIPLARWTEAAERAEAGPEAEEIAKHYAIESKEIVEPTKETLVAAARNYLAAKQLMSAGNCQGISLDCSPLLSARQMACGTCLAWSRLLDEGQIAACEADADAAVSLMLVSRLFGRPGFMQDPAPNSVDNTVIASHCTCATRLHGFNEPPATYTLRSHAESNTGVALRVEWQPDEPLTIVRFERPDSLLVGTGRMVNNVDARIKGGCRTAVEIAVDGLDDARDLAGFHQVLVCGKFDRELKMYAELAGLRLADVNQATT